MLYALDIETTGLDPVNNKMVSVAIAAPNESLVLISDNEASLFRDLLQWLTNPVRERGTLVTWNGACFDWPFMLTRAQQIGADEFLSALQIQASEHRQPPYRPINGHDDGYLVRFAGHDHVDVMHAWKPWSKERKISNSLKTVAKANGIDVIEVDRTKIESLTRAELAAYNISDVAATLILAEKIGDAIQPWLDSVHLPSGMPGA